MEACVESLKRLIKLFPGTIGAKPSLWYIYIYIYMTYMWKKYKSSNGLHIYYFKL